MHFFIVGLKTSYSGIIRVVSESSLVVYILVITVFQEMLYIVLCLIRI